MLKKWLKVMMTCGDIQAIVRHINIDQEFDALDGVNPYKSIFTKWSTWVVNVLNYHLPPYLVIKHEHILLALIIPRKSKL